LLFQTDIAKRENYAKRHPADGHINRCETFEIAKSIAIGVKRSIAQIF
jgi:hypothetical protein